MKRFLMAALILTPGFALAHAATLDGTWHVDGDVAGNPVAPVCVLAEKEGKITGTCTGTDGKPQPVTGSVKQSAVFWSYDTTYEGGSITLSFTATQDKEGHLTGSVTVAPYAATGDFTAKRDAPAAKP